MAEVKLENVVKKFGEHTIVKNISLEVKNKEFAKTISIPKKIEEGEIDEDRRTFLKIIASAGAGLFFMTIFTKKTEAAFFGSAPQPSTLKLKDSQGNIIDPAEKNPTDGFRITQIDDSSTPTYYGFVDKNGSWFIMKEESSGAYRYVKGDSNFSNSWSNRTSLTYGYFDEVF